MSVDTGPQNRYLPFQPLHHHGQYQRTVKCQGPDCRPAQGWATRP